MSRAQRQPAERPQIGKAPSTGHPARQAETYVEELPNQTEQLVNFGARIRESTRRRARVYGAAKDMSLQDVMEQALTEFLDRHGA